MKEPSRYSLCKKKLSQWNEHLNLLESERNFSIFEKEKDLKNSVPGKEIFSKRLYYVIRCRHHRVVYSPREKNDKLIH